MTRKSRIRRFLDGLLGSRLSTLVPALLAAALYLLFVLLGAAEEKQQLLIAAPVVGIFCFFGVLLVLGFQTRRTKDAVFAARAGRFLNGFTLLFAIGLGMSALFSTARFLADLNSYDPGNAAFPLGFAALALAHRWRRD